ncbi:MAG: glucosaminidase domain-containing protein [Bacteroidia bacterium]|jgi:LysM repeat protein
MNWNWSRGVRVGVVFLLFGLMNLVELKGQLMSTREYIDSFKSIAMQEMRMHGVPASITLGQGVLESASGNSKLAKNCNNHFGIKCRSNWTGTFCLADDDAKDECFRGYPSVYESYRDHSLFLKNSKRYFPLFELSATDYKGWATGLREAGYATNPSYANILIGVIEKYHLGQFDSMVVMGDDYVIPSNDNTNNSSNSGNSPLAGVSEVNGIQAIIAKPGETPEALAARYNMGVWQIYKYNDIEKGQMLNPGEIIYLKPKRRRSTETNHLVKPGESMREISQQYGVKVKHLYKLNRLEPGEEVQPGEVLNLRSKRSNPPTTLIPGSDTASKMQTAKPIDYRKFMSNDVSPVTGQMQDTYHFVKSGETLYSISKSYGVTVEQIRFWNSLSTNQINVGQRLKVRSAN